MRKIYFVSAANFDTYAVYQFTLNHLNVLLTK